MTNHKKTVDQILKWVGFLEYNMELRLDNRSYQPRPHGLAKAWILLSGRPWERKLNWCSFRIALYFWGGWEVGIFLVHLNFIRSQRFSFLFSLCTIFLLQKLYRKLLAFVLHISPQKHDLSLNWLGKTTSHRVSYKRKAKANSWRVF